MINAVARIDEDVQAYEGDGRAASLSEDERDKLYALKSKCNATLSNLTTAARNHATSHGLSPVSLLDAAASHLSMTIIELVRLLHLRKAGSVMNGAASYKVSSPRQSQQKNPNTAAQSAKYTAPQRLNSLKQGDQAISSGSNGRASPASSFSRSRTNTQERNVIDPHEGAKEDYFDYSDKPYTQNQHNQYSQKIASSTSGTSLASSNLHIDPRRNGMTSANRSDYQSFQETTPENEDDYNEDASGQGQNHYQSVGSEFEEVQRRQEDWTELKVEATDLAKWVLGDTDILHRTTSKRRLRRLCIPLHRY